jgi:type IV fimbrial biogenesis protein FimT
VNRTIPLLKSKSRGFTLIELMVTLTIVGILTTIAVPAFAKLIAANRLTTQANDLVAALNLARSEAVRRAQPVTLRADTSNNYALGWKIFPDLDASGDQESSTKATDGLPLRVADAVRGSNTMKRVTRSAAPAPFSYTDDTTSTSRMYVVFDSRGAITATTPAFFRVCDPKNTSVAGRIVQVNAVGKVSIDSVSATCS